MRYFITILLSFIVISTTAQNSISERAKSRINAIRSTHYNKAEKLKAEHEAFRKEILGKWGETQMVESTQKVWVEYSDNNTARSKVDFENGEVTVEVISEVDDSEETVIEKLKKSVTNLLESRGKTIDFKSEVVEQKPVTEQPIMENQIDISKYMSSEMNTTSAANVAKSIVSSESKIERDINTENGVKKVSSITLRLSPNHIPERAAKYSALITQYSKMFGIEEPLIYAIMEQESSFNPMARSAYAYGLMQLVPTSGGKDAYYYVHKTNKELTPEFLYDPDNNIKLGTAYIKLIMSRDFPNVKDKINKMLCTIAAYNTGAGNVARAFNGTRSPRSVTPLINNMNNAEVYHQLKNKLHHPETRDYIQKVTTNIKKYIK